MVVVHAEDDPRRRWDYLGGIGFTAELGGGCAGGEGGRGEGVRQGGEGGEGEVVEGVHRCGGSGFNGLVLE